MERARNQNWDSYKIGRTPVEIVQARKAEHGSWKQTIPVIEWLLQSGVRFQWLASGEGPMLITALSKQAPVSEQKKRSTESTFSVPILKTATLNRKTFVLPDSTKKAVTFEIEGCYGFRISNDQMVPKFEKNDIVVADPNRDPRHRDPAIVRLKSGEVLVREIRMFEGRIILHPVNPTESDLMLEKNDITFIHPIVLWTKG
jgi:hypothetical protein